MTKQSRFWPISRRAIEVCHPRGSQVVVYQNIAITRGNLLKFDTFPRVIGAFRYHRNAWVVIAEIRIGYWERSTIRHHVLEPMRFLFTALEEILGSLEA